jgi:hypothetical protein
MNMKAQIKLTDYANEREGDLANIRTAQNIFSHEEKAKIDKKVNEKEANKMNWESQMRDRQLKEQMDRLFY